MSKAAALSAGGLPITAENRFKQLRREKKVVAGLCAWLRVSDLLKIPDVKRPAQATLLEMPRAAPPDKSDHSKHGKRGHELKKGISLVIACSGCA
jgi:hypothetical protein